MSVAVNGNGRELAAPGATALLGVLGVVYGDIGTSPLYALKASLAHLSQGKVDRLEILGVLSLIFRSEERRVGKECRL